MDPDLANVSDNCRKTRDTNCLVCVDNYRRAKPKSSQNLNYSHICKMDA